MFFFSHFFFFFSNREVILGDNIQIEPTRKRNQLKGSSVFFQLALVTKFHIRKVPCCVCKLQVHWDSKNGPTLKIGTELEECKTDEEAEELIVKFYDESCGLVIPGEVKATNTIECSHEKLTV